MSAMLAIKQPGETFWIERVQVGDGVEVDTGYRAPAPEAPAPRTAVVEREKTKRQANDRVCAGRRKLVDLRVSADSRVSVDSRVQRFFATWGDELERWMNLLLALALFGILVILLAGNFLGQ